MFYRPNLLILQLLLLESLHCDKLYLQPYLALVAAGSDGSGAVRQIERICTGWRLRPLAPAHIVLTHAQTPDAIMAPKTLPEAERERCRTLGATMAAWLA